LKHSSFRPSPCRAERGCWQDGASRKTFWNDLQKARQKMADALVNGKAIELRFLVSQKLCNHYNIFQMSILHIVPKVFPNYFKETVSKVYCYWLW